ncbi:permease [Brachybacterium sp. P6-10-X1]|uniref:GntP family permease n=1 Tax=Brachybacterium sp. P6-10-X1 TaxID=1903186 RepID=UPI000971A0F9|nr:gluconate:H+ symporter [Brachybacterium sp. P6-10-X1]APX33665.1 permease [Brachybacterium sp. P6-10-X1]
MDWIQETGWESWLGAGGLIAVAVAAVAALLVMVIKLKIHAFLALILVSLFTAVAAGIPAGQVVPTMIWGFGDTLSSVALLVAIGAMLGAMVETSGGARALAEWMIRLFGEKRAPFALGVSALFIGFPIFMDAAFVLMVPIIYAVARRLGGNLLAFGIPVAAALSVMHVYLPPHPGPVAATTFLEANLGYVMILGLLLAFPTWFISGHLWGMFVSRRHRINVPDTAFAGLTGDEEEVTNPPGPATVLLILILPLILILLNTGFDALGSIGAVDPDSAIVQVMRMVGETPIALLITVLFTVIVLGFRRGKSGTTIEKTMDNALGPVCAVILITGAGGMFGGVLQATGIGDALADSLASIGIPLILAGYLIAVALRLAQGSATVALTTSAALIAPGIIGGDFSGIETACMVLALAAGSVFAGHVNDSGFWLVGRLLDMDVKTTLRVWTVQQAIESVVAFAIVLAVYGVVNLF